MLFDLDNFKDVNDTQGHDAGDKLLQDLASRLSFFAKRQKRSTGWEDEFALVSHDLTEEMALERAKVIREKISQPYQIYDSLIQIGACIGIVISDGKAVPTIYTNAPTWRCMKRKRGFRQRSGIPSRTASAPAGE